MFWKRQSYEVLPALSVRGEHLRRSMRHVTIAWMFGVVWMSCVTGSRQTIFVRCLGFAEWQLGLIPAIASAAMFVQFLAVILIERTGLRKYQFLYCGVAHRVVWVFIALIPVFLPVPSPWAVWTMLVLLACSSVMAALTEPAWQMWMGDLIPRRIRGRYFANRDRWATAVKIPLVIGLGLSLDHVKSQYGPEALLQAISVVFAVAGVLGVMDILQFRHIRDVVPAGGPVNTEGALPPARRWRRHFVRAAGRLLLTPLGDRSFRRVVFYSGCMTFAIMVSHSYFFLFLLEGLGFSQLGTDLLFMVLGPLAGMAAIRGWGKLMDRWGRRPVLMLATACTVVSITPYFLASSMTPNPQCVIDAVNGVSGAVGGAFGRAGWRWLGPGTPVGAWLVMSVSMLLGGVGWGGVMLAQQGIVLGFADKPGRGSHVAAFRVIVSLWGLIGGLMGSAVVWVLIRRDPIVTGPMLWNHWHATFAMSFLARVVGLLSLIGMPDPGSGRFRDMTQYLGSNAYSQITTLLSWPRRVLGKRPPRRGEQGDHNAGGGA